MVKKHVVVAAPAYLDAQNRAQGWWPERMMCRRRVKVRRLPYASPIVRFDSYAISKLSSAR